MDKIFSILTPKFSLYAIGGLLVALAIGAGIAAWQIIGLKDDLVDARAAHTTTKELLQTCRESNGKLELALDGQKQAIEAFKGKCQAENVRAANAAVTTLLKQQQARQQKIAAGEDAEAMNRWMQGVFQ